MVSPFFYRLLIDPAYPSFIAVVKITFRLSLQINKI